MTNFQKLTFWDWIQVILVSLLGLLGAISAARNDSDFWGIADISLTLIYIYMVVDHRVNNHAS